MEDVMRKSKSIAAACVMLFLLFSASAYAEPYTVLIGDIPGIESLVTLTKTLGEDMGATFEINKVPIQRMVNTIIANQADFGAPMLQLKDPNAIKNLPFMYSTGVIQQMCFILYTNKAKPIDVDNLKNGNSKGYKIESDVANMQMFNFKTLPSTNPVASFKKVNDGLIDGYIYGTEPGDSILRANRDSMKNIKRQLWDTYDIGYALAKGDKFKQTDKLLSDGLKKLKANGKLDKIMADVIKAGVYDDWQP
jgi:ABC-type proline/glycine betaine transport system substrate-binding protein